MEPVLCQVASQVALIYMATSNLRSPYCALPDLVPIWVGSWNSSPTNAASRIRLKNWENHRIKRSFHQRWFGSSFLRCSLMFNTATRIGKQIWIDLAIGRFPLTLANIPKLKFCPSAMSQLNLNTFDFVPNSLSSFFKRLLADFQIKFNDMTTRSMIQIWITLT